jgi:hypothetical protein
MQLGNRPEGRWSAAMYYKDDTLYIFGGGSYTGILRGQLYACTFNPEIIDEYETAYRKTIEDVKTISQYHTNRADFY